MVLAACGTGAEDEPETTVGGETTEAGAAATEGTTEGGETTEAAGGGGEVSDETFRIAVGVDLDTLDPAGQTTTTVSNMVDYIVETLTTINEEGEVLPNLATDWTVSDDGLVYTLELQEGVTFHDGEPFSAEAVIASLERALDPEVEVPVREHLTSIESMEAIDSHSLEITLSQPFPPFLAGLSYTGSGILSPASIQGENYTNITEPVGTGPYTFGEYSPGEKFAVQRYDDYWGELPYYGTVEFQIVPEDATRVGLVRAGQVDMIILPPVSDLPALESDPNLEVLMAPGDRTIFVAINNNVIDDPRIRQAMNYAVDKEAIIENVLFGAADPVDAPMHESLFGHCSVGGYEYDPDRARELLAEAGAENLEVSFIAPTGRYIQDFELAQAIAGYLGEVGIQTSPETMDWPTYVGAITAPAEEQTTDMHLLGWAPSFLDSFQHMVVFDRGSQPPDGLATAFYSNPEVDDLLDQAATEIDTEARADLYCQASEIVMDEAPWIFLHSQRFPIVYRAGLENISYRPNEMFYAVYARPTE